MRNMSFAITPEQVLNQTKDITRRFGWWFLKPGDLVQPVEKAMGLKAGETIVKLGSPIRTLDARGEPLEAITQEDVVREGFPDWTPKQFIQMLVRRYGVDPKKLVNRIVFEYTNLVPCSCGKLTEYHPPAHLSEQLCSDCMMIIEQLKKDGEL